MPAPIHVCLWFDHQAEEAARFYCTIFPDGRVGRIAYYGEAGQEIHGRPPGSVMTVEFALNGMRFTGLNGGPVFQLSEAMSLQVMCDTQAEIDHYWTALSEGGPPEAQQCGWLKDRYGLSWQVVPRRLPDMLLQMQKLDIEALEHAFDHPSDV